MSIAKVALDLPLPRLFDYVGADVSQQDIGARVLVPFGRTSKHTSFNLGVIVDVQRTSAIPDSKLKPISHIFRDASILPRDWLNLAEFCAGYYHKPLGEVILSSLPPRLRNSQPLPSPPQCYNLTRPSEVILAGLPNRARRKRALVERMATSGLDNAAVAAATSSERSLLRELLASGDVLAGTPTRSPRFLNKYQLTKEQAAVVDNISRNKDEFATHLLFGVTGSGKTEIYLHLIAQALAAHRQALVLVPEIALTPALEAAFSERFPGAAISVQHSAMPALERVRGWLDAQHGHADIVLGTRLAAFVPLKQPGIIVIDEEQDSSFKQQEGLRYSARDLAIYRARQAGIPVVLASATPSLESYQQALRGRYRLHTLSVRAHATARLPSLQLVDTRKHPTEQGLSKPVVEAIASRLALGEQTLVFLNRRGYAPVLSCPACTWISNCPDCAAHLVLHLAEKKLRCHHCGHAAPVPRACPSCGNLDLQPLGRGTQRLEDSLTERFPDARIVRIDADSTRNRGSLEALLDEAREGRANILLGTQILAKGHHFEKLTLVVVLNADAGLFASDYRSAERLFSQLEQVAGRAGRGDRPGEVWIQTRYPGHAIYRALGKHDYAGFAQAILEERRSAGFPPFVFEAALRAEAEDGDQTLGFLRKALALAPPDREGITLFHPAPMALPRLARMERAQLVIQGTSRPRLQRFLGSWLPSLYNLRFPKGRWHLDVDPTEF